MTSPSADDSSQILTPLAAALWLGITPELLYAYTIYPPKKARGETRRLPYVNDPHRSGFRQSDLEAFDQYLREGWSHNPRARPDVPTYIVDYLKVECGGQCARCGKGFKLANAHIVPWAETLSNHHHNLIRLCSGCHNEYDATHLIARAEMQALKQGLIARLRSRLTSPLLAGLGTRVPNPTSRFLGRDHELGVLVELLQSTRTISIEGPPGIGKTQLLLHALHRLPEQRRVLWIDIQAFRSVSDIELAVEVGLAAGGTAVQGRPLREALADVELTLVFDGVEDLSVSAGDELTDFFQSLISYTQRPQVVFTSQIELHGVDVSGRFTVAPLEREAGSALLRWNQTEPTNDHSDELEWLTDFCEGHPLALTLVRGLLEYFKSTAAVKRRISQHGAAALAAPTRQQHTPSTSLRACLLVAYETLSVEQRSCLFLVTHSPAGCIDHLFVRDHEYSIADVEADIAALLRWHLVDSEDWGGHARLHILSPIRAFVLHEWESEPASVRDKLRLHLTIMHTMQAVVLCDRHMQTADARYGVFRFDQELPNFLYTFRHAAHVSQTTTEYSQYVHWLTNSLMVYCFVRGLFDVGVSIMRAGAKAAERLGKLESAGSLLVQAVTLAKRAHNPAAMRAAVAELDRLSSGNLGPGLAGAAAMGRGDVALEESRLDDAEREFATAERSYRQAVDAIEIEQGAANAAEQQTDLIRMVAHAVKMQGFLHEQQKCSASAIECYERVVNLLEPSEDSLNIAATMHQLGNCYGDLRQYERSFRYYLEAAQRFHAIPVAEYLSNSLSEIGYVVIDWDTAAPGLPAVSEELLCAGLEDLTEQLSVCVATSLDVPVELHGPILRKIFGMIALASFSEHRGCLEDWAYELRETILRPAIGDANQPVTANPIFWMHLDLMVAVAGSISGAPQVASGGVSATLDEIRHLAFLAYKG